MFRADKGQQHIKGEYVNGGGDGGVGEGSGQACAEVTELFV